jgi:hypothetical protein
MIVLVVAAMAADLITFSLVVPLVTIEAEMNPIMHLGYEVFGVSFVAALKVACTIAIIGLVLRVRPGLRRSFAASVGVFIGLVGVYGNTTAWMGIQ